MADMFSAAIDSGKTGYQIDRKHIQEIRKISGFVYPDFLMKKTSYQSESILGILYRRAVDFKNQNQHLFEDQDTIVSINSSAKLNETYIRFYVKVHSRFNVDVQTICQELHSVFGLKAPPNITIEKWFYQYQYGFRI